MNDYERGIRDCDQGVPAQENASDSYVDGYGQTYEFEAVADHNLNQFNEMFPCL